LGNLFRVTWRVISKFLPRPTKKKKERKKNENNVTDLVMWNAIHSSLLSLAMATYTNTRNGHRLFPLGEKKKKGNYNNIVG
jgi:hypothetical protein